jgi:cardiolipin synthase
MPMKESLDIRNLWNLSGILTLLRLPLALVFPFVAADPLWATVVLLLAAGSDAFDGVVARWMGTQSHMGGFTDGWVDKIFNINAGWSLVVFDWMPWWASCLLFTREWVQIPMVPYYVARYMRGDAPSNEPLWSGKLCSVLLVVSMISALWTFLLLMWVTLSGAAILGAYTTMIYLKREFEQEQKIDYNM